MLRAVGWRVTGFFVGDAVLSNGVGIGEGASGGVFTHVSVGEWMCPGCMWSVCEWSGGCVGLRIGHIAGGCAFARQAQAVLMWLVLLPRTPDL